MNSELDPKRYLGGAPAQGGNPQAKRPVMQHPSKEPQPVLGFDKNISIKMTEGAWMRIFNVKKEEE